MRFSQIEVKVPNGYPVHNLNTGFNYTAIQEAIDANETQDGHTIFVEIGTYYEKVFVNKTVTLIGENRETTMINGNRTGSALYVTKNNVTISNFTITGSQRNYWKACGVYVNSSNNVFDNNIITDNNWGICFEFAHNNIVSSNLMFNNTIAHYMTDSDNNIFEKNNLTDNGIGFYSLWSDHNIFSENRAVENKGEGFLLLHCSFCTLEKNRVISGSVGFWLDPVSNSLITENILVDNKACGIRFHGYSYDNVVVDNVIIGSEEGLLLHDTTDTTIFRNTISENERGVAIHGGSSIKVWYDISYNNIINNTIGVWQSFYNFGRISQNNFINNSVQAENENKSYIQWDNSYPSGGNYWSDYNGTDSFRGAHQNLTCSDGIGDTAYVIDEFHLDNYPLMAPVTAFDAGTWNNISYYVAVASNSSLSDFHLNPNPKEPFIAFNISGENRTTGFCRVAIPRSLLWVEDGWNIVVGDTQITEYIWEQDENNTYMYFIYSHSLKQVKITGTHFIPEFHSTAMALLLSVLSALAIIVKKRHFPRIIGSFGTSTSSKKRLNHVGLDLNIRMVLLKSWEC